MNFLRRKADSLQVTLDGQVHMIEVTRATTCNDVIRQVLQTYASDVSVDDFSVFKLSSTGNVKQMKNEAKMTGKRRLFGTSTSTTEYIIKRTLPDLDEDLDWSDDEDSFCQSSSYTSSLRDLRERLQSIKSRGDQTTSCQHHQSLSRSSSGFISDYNSSVSADSGYNISSSYSYCSIHPATRSSSSSLIIGVNASTLTFKKDLKTTKNQRSAIDLNECKDEDTTREQQLHQQGPPHTSTPISTDRQHPRSRQHPRHHLEGKRMLLQRFITQQEDFSHDMNTAFIEDEN